MIHVFFSKVEEELHKELFNSLLQQLPNVMHDNILRYRKWQDRQSALFGKLLLAEGLKTLGHKSFLLNSLKYTDLKRPYIDGFFDFNISHSGAYTVCAIAEDGKVGVDIEEIKNIPVSDFTDQFSEKEISKILTSDNILHSFYMLWTQKEAFLKAIGTGLFFPLNKVFIEENKIVWNNDKWFLHDLKISKDYPCHFCTPIAAPDVVVKQIVFV